MIVFIRATNVNSVTLNIVYIMLTYIKPDLYYMKRNISTGDIISIACADFRVHKIEIIWLFPRD